MIALDAQQPVAPSNTNVLLHETGPMVVWASHEIPLAVSAGEEALHAASHSVNPLFFQV